MSQKFLKTLIDQKKSFDRSCLPNEVELLKDSLVYLREHFSKLWQEQAQLKKDLKILQQKVDCLEKENAALKTENLVLTEEVALLKNKIFGKKSEKAQRKPPDSAPANKNRSGQQPKRKKLPAHLPRNRVVHDLPEDEKVCLKCHGVLKPIGEEVSEQLELVRSYLQVIEQVRLKYACTCCRQTIVVAKTPYKPIEKGIAGPYLIAYVVVSKFVDHLPLYRQESIFKRHHVSISRSTLCGWVMAAAQSLKPIYDRMKYHLLNGNHIYTDDTYLLTLRIIVEENDGKKRSQAHKSYMWVYARDGNHGQQPIVIYNYTLGRGSDSVEEFLKDFKGYIQADAYGAYDFLFKVSKDKETVCIEVACWAHTRRKFVDALIANPDSIAAEVIELMGQLYNLERKFKDQALTPEEICKQRQLRSKPILLEIHTWLKSHEQNVPPSCTLGKAIAYALNNWEALSVFVTDGKLAIDNNFSERNMKTIVLGRKNYLFAGSEMGGESAAILYSVLETCKQNGVDAEAYLADVLLNVHYHPNHRIDELLPYNWDSPGKSQQNNDQTITRAA